MSKWYVYLIQCRDDSLYTGITTDLDRRILEHNTDDNRSALYTKLRRPVKLVYFEKSSSRSKATIREQKIKKMLRKKKLELVNDKKSKMRMQRFLDKKRKAFKGLKKKGIQYK